MFIFIAAEHSICMLVYLAMYHQSSSGDVGTCGHGYKLSKTYCASTTRYWFFTERVINVWNNLPQDIVDFTSITSFQRTIKLVNFNAHLKVFVQ